MLVSKYLILNPRQDCIACSSERGEDYQIKSIPVVPCQGVNNCSKKYSKRSYKNVNVKLQANSLNNHSKSSTGKPERFQFLKSCGLYTQEKCFKITIFFNFKIKPETFVLLKKKKEKKKIVFSSVSLECLVSDGSLYGKVIGKFAFHSLGFILNLVKCNGYMHLKCFICNAGIMFCGCLCYLHKVGS